MMMTKSRMWAKFIEARIKTNSHWAGVNFTTGGSGKSALNRNPYSRFWCWHGPSGVVGQAEQFLHCSGPAWAVGLQQVQCGNQALMARIVGQAAATVDAVKDTGEVEKLASGFRKVGIECGFC